MPHHSSSNQTRKKFLRLFRIPTDGRGSHRNQTVLNSGSIDANSGEEHRGIGNHPHHGLFNHTRHEKPQVSRVDKANNTLSQQQQRQEPVFNSPTKPPRPNKMGNIHQISMRKQYPDLASHPSPFTICGDFRGQSVNSSGASSSGRAPSYGFVATSTGQDHSEPSTSTAAKPLRPANGPTTTSKYPNTNSNTLKSPVTPIATAITMDPKVTAELMHLRSMLKEKDRRLDELHSEVDKLSSVLEQHIGECDTWKKNPPAIAESLLMRVSSLRRNSFNTNATAATNAAQGSVNSSATPGMLVARSPLSSDGSAGATSSPTSADGLAPLRPPAVAGAGGVPSKRLGVSAEPTMAVQSTAPVEIKYYDKDAKSRQEIRNALRNNEFLRNLDAVQLQEIVSCMYKHSIVEGCYVIREGEDGHHLYVAAEGEYEVWKNGKYLYTMGPGNCFGELALLYNCKRTASIKAVRAANIWVLERSIFQYIMMKTGLEKMEARVKFLSSVPLLKDLEQGQLQRIADVLEAQFHPDGECIIRQDEQADSFFIIQSGEVRVTMKVVGPDGVSKEIEIRRMRKGEYFGEKALLGEGRRTANIYAASPAGVELLCLYRKDFLELMGNIADLEHKEYVDLEHLQSQGGQLKVAHPLKLSEDDPTVTLTAASPTSLDQLLGQRDVKASAGDRVQPPPSRKLYVHEYKVSSNLHLTDLERVAVIGQGGFGRVELVRPISDHSIAFALKRMKKVHIVETKQQDHVHSEKQILMSVDNCFICKLFKTFRDNKFVYMLMEFCPGGELWTVLRDRRAFDDKLTRFSLACVIEAFDYLHHQGIIYRDLKPENMLLTSTGYIKLCDFGFAKRLGPQRKTWTFCGTPEYVAPEVILNKGHDFAADYWSLGILTCELLMGTPPFQASEPIKIYMKALRGIEAYDLSHHKNISVKAYQFIKRLCRNTPTERLGMGRQGIQEIRNQKYFQGFDWDGVRNQTLQSPFHPKVNGPCDFSNFDQFPVSDDLPPDEMSGWDINF
ncbi:cGMP dependent protein kinase [Echinococcus multilocularis]|uniref:cGMP-dependent protein kinase n=1 Tax=Echinococcus multilocularis TaxID=6211 RepID=A0A087VZG3_ECHMU|nr:cGMP dependent protein kinase [Echinococcus multilocularis]